MKHIEKIEDWFEELSQEEEAYRRGFSHGWHVGKTNETVTKWDISEWRESRKLMGAPGTPYSKRELSGDKKILNQGM